MGASCIFSPPGSIANVFVPRNVYVRREISDLMKNYPDQWNLYMLALDDLHRANQSDPYSFYGLASIHGRPYRTWGDSPGLPYKIGKAGYCPHDNELFLGWHRPYLALFEQVVSSYVRKIATKAPADQLKRFLTAADEFRIPYWDWAQGTRNGPVPDIFVTSTTMVRDTAGMPVVLSNPLYSYKFQPLPEGFDGKWRKINSTVRWPASDDPWAPSQPSLFSEAFKNQSNNLIAQTGVAFRSSSFSRFTSSLEDAHGWVHGVIGGGYTRDSPYWGHMWPLEYSAFEPLFMLHHANVDRLFALYQAAHPSHWMQPSAIGTQGNVFLEDRQIITADTELIPFRKSPGAFWTTNDCRRTTVLGYAYPETQDWTYASDFAYQTAVNATISNLYSGRIRSQIALAQQQGTAFGAVLSSNGNTFTDWSVETQAPASGMSDTFIVGFSLVGTCESDAVVDAGSWMVLRPRHEDGGRVRVRVRGEAVGEGGEKKVEEVLTGTTSLTSHLIDRVNEGRLASLSREDVVPYLTESLSWDVVDASGTRVTHLYADKLRVTVCSAGARVPGEADKRIEYDEETTEYPEITMGRIEGGKRLPDGMMLP
ncbi:Di-copper centre-containing protein [Stemphylium lycopersici]|nr:Di-copper centre-containing protein [Stemphylium lycopersici]